MADVYIGISRLSPGDNGHADSKKGTGLIENSKCHYFILSLAATGYSIAAGGRAWDTAVGEFLGVACVPDASIGVPARVRDAGVFEGKNVAVDDY